MFNSKIQPPLKVGITSQLLREVERLEDEDGEATEAPWRYPHLVSSEQYTHTLYLYIRDNTAEHLALFTFSHLMQTESPFHNKWSPFFPESPFHQTPDPLWTEDHHLSFSILKVRVEVLFFPLIFHTTTSSIRVFDWNCILHIFWELKTKHLSLYSLYMLWKLSIYAMYVLLECSML